MCLFRTQHSPTLSCQPSLTRILHELAFIPVLLAAEISALVLYRRRDAQADEAQITINSPLFFIFAATIACLSDSGKVKLRFS